jgi:hypothetical protein
VLRHDRIRPKNSDPRRGLTGEQILANDNLYELALYLVLLYEAPTVGRPSAQLRHRSRRPSPHAQREGRSPRVDGRRIPMVN